MKREVSVPIIAVLIVAAAFLFVFYLGVKPTGFAVSNTIAGQSATFSLNASSLLNGTLEPNGQYVFSTNNTGEWVNDTPVNFTGTPSWANVTKILNSTVGTVIGYVWYLTDNEGNQTNTEVFVLVTTEEPAPVPGPTVSISQPSGEGSSLTEIPLAFSITTSGTNLTCTYRVDYAGGELVANTSVSCVNGTNTATFNLPEEGGDNILTLYLTDSSGSVVASSSVFQVSVPSATSGGESEEETEGEEVLQLPEEEIPQTVTAIAVGAVVSQDVVQGSSRDLSLAVQNTGTTDVTSCTLSGDSSGWVAVSSAPSNIGAGATSSFAFTVAVPEETAAGSYTLNLDVSCAETASSTSFNVNVLQKKLDFNITDVQRTRADRVSVDYTLTELAGEDQDLQIYFAIKDSAGTEVANASQNRSVDANDTSNFRTNIRINETINGTMTLSAAFNSQIFSSSVLEPIDLSTITGGAIFGGIGAGSVMVVVLVVVILGAILFAARKMRKSRAAQ